MDVISEKRKVQILDLLQNIEHDNNITILHAVESGSRAWGFPSADSDYDIRFIYYHPREWYISAFDKKDHIDIDIYDDLDAGGWDIGKCMRLLHKGNATLHEWLTSPVVYRTHAVKHSALKQLATDVFNPASAYYHYLSLAKKKMADEKTGVNAKYFLYGLRALLCAKWIVEHNTAPPVLFDVLVQTYLAKAEKIELMQVLATKAKGGESDDFVIPEGLWTGSENIYMELSKQEVPAKKVDSYELFDKALIEITQAESI